MILLWITGAVVLLAAFLLFQIELIMAKLLLPEFGGSYLVWGACVAFFQGMLLGGYLYAHLVLRKQGIDRYRPFHFLLMGVPLLFFPGRPLPDISPHASLPLAADVFVLLLVTVGPVFFVLSTMSVVMQDWTAASRLPGRHSPYFLYAVSNFGSFAALLSYPFVFEARLDLGRQLILWRWGYTVLLILFGVVFLLVRTEKDNREGRRRFEPAAPQHEAREWFLLAAAGPVLFLSVTNILTYEVAPVPLLWVVPLCIYLLSYALNFRDPPLCPLWMTNRMPEFMGLGVVLFFLAQKRILPYLLEVAAFLILLFVLCMFCQRELYRRRPADVSRLTTYYLWIAFGGFAGGVLVSWVIPLLSKTMAEFLIGLAVLTSALIKRRPWAGVRGEDIRWIVYAVLFLVLWPMVFRQYSLIGLIVITAAFWIIYGHLKKNPQALFLSLIPVILLISLLELLWTQKMFIDKHRNYYGIYKVYCERGKVHLMHGATIHGVQYIEQAKRKIALAYFHRRAPVGEVLTSDLFRFTRVAVVGLGTGTLARYTSPRTYMDFFEIDPDVYKMAGRHFTYLRDARGRLRFVFGDARLTLRQMPENHYDLIIIDAFSGDSVPVHLLTVEAIAEYRRHLSPGGLILFHVSNLYLDLVPVVAVNARHLGAECSVKFYRKQGEEDDAFFSLWAAVSWDRSKTERLRRRLQWNTPRFKEGIRPWTDQYTNLLPVIRLKDFVEELTGFDYLRW